MPEKIRLIDAIEEVLLEDPKTRENKYQWTFLAKVLRKLGFKIWIEFDPALPSPDAMLTERRTVLNKKNKFPEDFEPEPNTTYEKPAIN